MSVKPAVVGVEPNHQALHPTGTSWKLHFNVPVQWRPRHFVPRVVWTDGATTSTAFHIPYDMVRISEDGLSAAVNYAHGKELRCGRESCDDGSGGRRTRASF